MASCGYGAAPVCWALRSPRPRRWRVSQALPSDGKGRDERILKSLDELGASLAALSSAISGVSAAVTRLSETIRGNDEQVEESRPSTAESRRIPASSEDRNALAHQIALTIQQSFLQSRIEGLGKPFEVAVDEFVSACMKARASGFGMQELQLQLILADGALPGAFSMSTDDPLASYIMNEEARIRAAWIRYVYVALTEVENLDYRIVDLTAKPEEQDPGDFFVKQVLERATQEGYNLEKLKLEQKFSGPATSPAVKALRQANYLVLLTFEKAKRSTT